MHKSDTFNWLTIQGDTFTFLLVLRMHKSDTINGPTIQGDKFIYLLVLRMHKSDTLNRLTIQGDKFIYHLVLRMHMTGKTPWSLKKVKSLKTANVAIRGYPFMIAVKDRGSPYAHEITT